MSKVSICETGWINLVFDGRNKEYGAYQLRQENPKTLTKAFFFGLLFTVFISGLGLLFSSFKNKPDLIKKEESPVIRITKFDNIRKLETEKMVIPMKKKIQKLDETKKLVNPEITSDVKQADEVKPNSVANSTSSDSGTVITTNTTTDINTSVGTNIGNKKLDNTPVETGMLDKLPEFPGGMDKFYTYVGSHFEKPEIDIEKTINIYVSFVIETDGSMTTIKVLHDPGYGLSKEAIRVLTSLKTKWKPGIVDGKSVRTSYSLPITIKME